MHFSTKWFKKGFHEARFEALEDVQPYFCAIDMRWGCMGNGKRASFEDAKRASKHRFKRYSFEIKGSELSETFESDALAIKMRAKLTPEQADRFARELLPALGVVHWESGKRGEADIAGVLKRAFGGKSAFCKKCDMHAVNREEKSFVFGFENPNPFADPITRRHREELHELAIKSFGGWTYVFELRKGEAGKKAKEALKKQ